MGSSSEPPWTPTGLLYILELYYRAVGESSDLLLHQIFLVNIYRITVVWQSGNSCVTVWEQLCDSLGTVVRQSENSCATVWEQLCDSLGTVVWQSGTSSSYAISLSEQLPFMQLVTDAKKPLVTACLQPCNTSRAIDSCYGHGDE